MRVVVLACAILIAAPAISRADPEVDLLKKQVAQLEVEIKLLKDRLAKLEGEKKSLSPVDPAKTPKFVLIPGGWGDAGADDILAVCKSAASELSSLFPDRELDPISIKHDEKQGPMVIYGRGTNGERRVLLNSKGRLWAQFSFQFAHEVCHILCNYRDGDRTNLWFEETLCETASLFVLRRMAETWKTKPPYPNWKSYADNLRDYADQRLRQTEKLEGLTLAQWYKRNEPELRKSGALREKNAVVAAALLPLLEKNPKYWQSVSYLNQGDPKKERTFPEHLRDWHERVPKDLKPFVADVAALFEISLK
ncbi:MAG: hypothetical protein K8T89_24315 [Planctomycetes bacterium]|nr:hypothetical protein [Planctomycetota bacterium]